MNIKRPHLFRAIVMVALISSSTYLASGKDSPPSVYIVRNVAWNDFIAQIASVPYESPDRDLETLRNELSYKEEQAKLGR
jgi:hypothetical protein